MATVALLCAALALAGGPPAAAAAPPAPAAALGAPPTALLALDAYGARAVTVLPDGERWGDTEEFGSDGGKGLVVSLRERGRPASADARATFMLVVTRQLGPTPVTDFAARLQEDGPAKGFARSERTGRVRFEGRTCDAGACIMILEAATHLGAGVQAACMFVASLEREVKPDCEAWLASLRLGRPGDWALTAHRALRGPEGAEAGAGARVAEGLAAFESLRWADAVTAFDAALAAGGDVPAWHLDRAIALVALDRFDEGLKAAGRVEDDAALGADARRVRCEALILRGDRRVATERAAEALADFRAAQACAPADPRGHAGEARAFLELSRPDAVQAEKAANAGLALAPADVGSLVVRSKARVRLGKNQAALADLDAAIAARPTGEAHFLRGVLRRTMGDRAGAQADALAASLLEPELIPLFRELFVF